MLFLLYYNQEGTLMKTQKLFLRPELRLSLNIPLPQLSGEGLSVLILIAHLQQ